MLVIDAMNVEVKRAVARLKRELATIQIEIAKLPGEEYPSLLIHTESPNPTDDQIHCVAIRSAGSEFPENRFVVELKPDVSEQAENPTTETESCYALTDAVDYAIALIERASFGSRAASPEEQRQLESSGSLG